MDTTAANFALDLALYLAATFAAALVTGIAGFAFGLIAAAVWLHILTPVQTATLIVGFGFVVQGVSVWKLRRALKWSRLWPFLVGGALGVPLGVAVLEWANPDHVRFAIGAILIVFSVYSFARPMIKVTAGGAPADAGVGFLNGVLGGLTGLAGILTTIWCGMRGWPKDEQRAVFQPIGVAIFAMSAFWLGVKGAVSSETAWLFVAGLPVLLLGTWLGLRLYGTLDEAGFRKVVLALLLVSGIALLAPLASVITASADDTRDHVRAETVWERSMKIDIAGMTPGNPPTGFVQALTGQGGAVRWQVLDDASAPAGRVIAETSRDTADYRFPLSILENFTARDVQVAIRFKAVAGSVDQAAGIIVRALDKDNYYVARANALEDNVRLYKVVNGVRRQLAGKNIKVASGAWHTLGLKADGDNLEVAFDGERVIEFQDRTFTQPGRIGLWTKADSLTHFAAIEISSK